ncbi:hypothetical protein AKJ16_DCAP00030 [Drosera capensis]
MVVLESSLILGRYDTLVFIVPQKWLHLGPSLAKGFAMFFTNMPMLCNCPSGVIYNLELKGEYWPIWSSPRKQMTQKEWSELHVPVTESLETTPQRRWCKVDAKDSLIACFIFEEIIKTWWKSMHTSVMNLVQGIILLLKSWFEKPPRSGATRFRDFFWPLSYFYNKVGLQNKAVPNFRKKAKIDEAKVFLLHCIVVFGFSFSEAALFVRYIESAHAFEDKENILGALSTYHIEALHRSISAFCSCHIERLTLSRRLAFSTAGVDEDLVFANEIV